MRDSSGTYAQFDLEALNWLPSGWHEQIVALAEANSFLTHLDGKSSTSREPEGSKGTDVFVVTGAVIHDKLRWLYELYSSQLLQLANEHFAGPYVIAESLDATVNVNLLRGFSARYEWHVDSNPLTGILFVTDHVEEDGGCLVFRLKEHSVRVLPKRGMFILFDARNIPHTVEPLKRETSRISVPMNYYLAGVPQMRPDDLDPYIYKPLQS